MSHTLSSQKWRLCYRAQPFFCFFVLWEGCPFPTPMGAAGGEGGPVATGRSPNQSPSPSPNQSPSPEVQVQVQVQFRVGLQVQVQTKVQFRVGLQVQVQTKVRQKIGLQVQVQLKVQPKSGTSSPSPSSWTSKSKSKQIGLRALPCSGEAIHAVFEYYKAKSPRKTPPSLRSHSLQQ